MPSLKDLRIRIDEREVHAQDHQGDEDGGGGEAAPRAGGAPRPRVPMPSAWRRVLANLARRRGGPARRRRGCWSAPASDDVHLLVVATAERGLCGGFNSSIVRLARDPRPRLLAEGKTVKILTVGKKGREQLRRDFGAAASSAMSISSPVKQRRLRRRVARSPTTSLTPLRRRRVRRLHAVLQPLPVGDQPDPDRAPADPGGLRGRASDGAAPQYEYEPDEEAILADLLPRNLATQIFTALLENGASEQGARMTAMDNATRNAGDMIDQLTLNYNRSRQQAITKELIEIISGAEAL